MPLDPDTREREYSPSSVIGGDYAPFLERYRTESAAALRTLAVQRNLSYGDASSALIDYFPAPVSASRPGLLVYFHGGYWQELSKAESAFLAAQEHLLNPSRTLSLPELAARRAVRERVQAQNLERLKALNIPRVILPRQGQPGAEGELVQVLSRHFSSGAS